MDHQIGNRERTGGKHKIFVIVPVHNRKAVTERFVSSLKAQTYPDWHLVLVDDGCTDGTPEMVLKEVPSASIIRGNGNLWWGGSLELAYQWILARLHASERTPRVAETDVILIINDDTEFAPDFIENGVAALLAHPKALIGAQAYSLQTGALLEAGIHVDWSMLRFSPAARAEDVNCLSTRGLFFHASDFEKIGGIRAKELPHYAADYEFTIRAHRLGYRLLAPSTVKVRMDESTTGMHDIRYESFSEFIEKCFSLRNLRNPVVWTRFLLVACPPPWLPLNLVRVTKNTATEFIRAAIHQRKT